MDIRIETRSTEYSAEEIRDRLTSLGGIGCAQVHVDAVRSLDVSTVINIVLEFSTPLVATALGTLLGEWLFAFLKKDKTITKIVINGMPVSLENLESSKDVVGYVGRVLDKT